jgi:hypothetical protein
MNSKWINLPDSEEENTALLSILGDYTQGDIPEDWNFHPHLCCLSLL